MDLFTIPLDDNVIIYRPLRRLAFVGNQAMASLAQRLALETTPAGGFPDDIPEDARTFLAAIGFLEPDSPAPPAPRHEFCPTTAVLLTTNRCQLRCIYCYADAGIAAPQDLSWELAQAVIDQVCANALATGRRRFDVSFHGGGEPVLAWELIQQATAYARSKPLPCSISLTSNGIWSPSQGRWIVKNLNSVSLSLDGGPRTQDRQRPFVSGQGSSEIVLRSLAQLDKAHFDYGIRMTALPPWEDTLPVDVQFLCEHTLCRTFQVEPAFNAVRGHHRRPAVEEAEAFASAFGMAYEIAQRAGRQLNYSAARPWQVTQVFCQAPYGALIVGPTGQLVSCYEVTRPDHPLAGISTVGRVTGHTVTVDQVAREALLARIDARRALCQDCFCRWNCAGDCYVRSFDDDGAYDRFGARCHANRAILTQTLLWAILQGNGVWQGMVASNGQAVTSESPFVPSQPGEV